MQDGDFAVVIFPYADELKEYLEAKQAIHELFQSISDYLTEFGAALSEAFAPAEEIVREIFDLSAQYADGEEVEDSEEHSFPETVSCYIPKSGHLSHQNRIPWYTCGFQ